MTSDLKVDLTAEWLVKLETRVVALEFLLETLTVWRLKEGPNPIEKIELMQKRLMAEVSAFEPDEDWPPSFQKHLKEMLPLHAGIGLGRVALRLLEP